MTKFKNQILFNYKTSLLGLFSAIYAVAQPFMNNDTSLSMLIHDQAFILALMGAVLGFIAKDGDKHGTAEAPITPEAAGWTAKAAQQDIDTVRNYPHV